MFSTYPQSNAGNCTGKVKLADGSYSAFAFLYFDLSHGGAKAMVPDRGLVPLA
jgi:hypothetical protein